MSMADGCSSGHRDEQAALWCMRFAEGRLEPEEDEAFRAWLADPINNRRFAEAAAVWQGIDSIAHQPELIHLRSDALEKLRVANSRRWGRRMTSRWYWPAAAAVLVAGVGVAMLLVRQPTQIYETGIGERRVAVMKDGSRLSLDAFTRVKVELEDDRRSLTLISGRAKFDVAKDPLRPFSVSVGNRVVVATGTAFSVELLQRQMRVLLYEGRVEVLHKASELAKARPLALDTDASPSSARLTPGKELVAALDRPTASVIPADLSRSLSWEAGQLDFAGEPLDMAVERMNRYSQEQLVIADPAVARFTISGVFTAGDTDAFLEGVRSFFPVEVVRARGKIVLKTAAPDRNFGARAVPPAG